MRRGARFKGILRVAGLALPMAQGTRLSGNVFHLLRQAAKQGQSDAGAVRGTRNRHADSESTIGRGIELCGEKAREVARFETPYPLCNRHENLPADHASCILSAARHRTYSSMIWSRAYATASAASRTASIAASRV